MKKNRNNSNKGRKHKIFLEEPPRKIDMTMSILTLSVTIALFGNTASFITRKYFHSYCTTFFKVSIQPRISSHQVYGFCFLRNSLRKTFCLKSKKILWIVIGYIKNGCCLLTNANPVIFHSFSYAFLYLQLFLTQLFS